MRLAARGLLVGERVGPLDLVLEPGRVTAICGPNGAGKSSLLRALAGLLPPDAGEVCLADQPLPGWSLRDRARAVGFLPQGAELAWDVTVRSLVALGRTPHGDRATAPVEAALAALDCSPLADRRVFSLSGGERARVLLARVLAGEPRWILADEPFAALDLGHQGAMLDHLRRLAKVGVGVAVVVHDLALARNGADRVVVLNEGRVAADGPPERALGPEVIAAVWGVEARWLGEPGHWALALDTGAGLGAGTGTGTGTGLNR